MKKIWLTCLMFIALIMLVTSSNVLAQTNLYNNTTIDFTVFASSAADYQSYLPIVFGPPQEFLLFPNGDFEQGPGVWDEYSTNGWELIVEALAPGVSPYEGTWAVWMGGDINETSYIVQQVVVPTNLPYVSYWYRIESIDECGNDIGSVLVNDVVVDTYSLCSANNTGGWVKRVLDLNAYVGDSVFIKIQAVCDGAKNSNLFIDYVGFQRTQ